MRVGLVYAGEKQIQLNCYVEDAARVSDVIEQSGILKMCPDIDLNTQKIGVFGKFVKQDSELKEGDRIEIYRKITRVMDDDDDDDE
ncbi:RnfH family protein [Teredinibacter haidensis]|uniref:RnfH family protein n=1 Tax=Teredinibacter haidensis TaxID=2731755 RepID=UPI0009489C12|nr:RnfH family protein [Teredinibacter haidensis]